MLRMKPDPKMNAIRSLPPFQHASDREIRALSAVGDMVALERGEVIGRADHVASESFVVMDGLVDVVVDGTIVATLQPGQIVGELSVLDGKPRSADIVAATDVTLLAMTPPVMRGLIETNRAVRAAVISQLTERLRRADEDLAALSA
jgi:CRP/FNR family transcriptional regulator, cyclic AMP receptor protein